MKPEQTTERLQTFLNRRTQYVGTINAFMDIHFVDMDKNKAKVILAYPIKAWQLNPASNLHGGMLASAIDITMGCCAYIFSEADFTPTSQLSINFIKAVLEEEVLVVEAITDHVGSRLIQTRAIAFIEGKEEIVASANGTYANNHSQGVSK